MSVTSTPTARADREAGRMHSGKRARKNNIVWAAQVLLAAVFVFAAVPKLAGANSAAAMFGQIGAGPWLRYLVGTAELAGAVGLLIPRLAGLAAAGLAADMVGASIINIAVLHSAAVALTIPLCAALALIAPLGAHHQAPGSANRAVTPARHTTPQWPAAGARWGQRRSAAVSGGQRRDLASTLSALGVPRSAP